MSWDSVVITETRLWAGQSGVRILAGARDFCFLQNVQNGSGAQPASCSVGTRIISWRCCVRGVMLTTRLRLALRLRMSRAVLLLSLHAFLPWTSTTYPFYKPSSVLVICFRLVLLKVTEPSYAAVVCMLLNVMFFCRCILNLSGINFMKSFVGLWPSGFSRCVVFVGVHQYFEGTCYLRLWSRRNHILSCTLSQTKSSN
jgi:hypothetical protein